MVTSNEWHAWAALGLLAISAALGCGGTHTAQPVERSPTGHVEPTPARLGPGAAAQRLTLPDPARGDPVSLAKVLAWADEHAPGLKVAKRKRERVEAAFAEAEPWAPSNPVAKFLAGPRFSSDGTDYNVQASLWQSLEVAGERGRRLASAQAFSHQIEAQVAAARWDVHQAVHHSFHDALAARERLATARRLLDFEEKLLEVQHKRLKAGDASPLSVRIAEGELARAEQWVLGARQKYVGQRMELAEVAGWPAAHPPVPAGELDPPREPPPAQSLLHLATKHHPALHALNARIERAKAAVELADREAWPTPSVGAQYQREGNVVGADQHAVMGGLQMSLPVWRRNPGGRAKARAEVAEARAARDAFRQRLTARVVRGVHEVELAAERVEVFGERVLPALEENLHMLQRAHELGEISVLEASTAVERFLRAREDALHAYSEYHHAVAELEAAVGSDLWQEEHHEEEAP